MQIAIDESGPTAKVVLTGRLDIAGAEVVAMPLATLAGNKDNIAIDMSGVSFVASIGLRHLVATAKVVVRRGGRLVLVDTRPAVAEVITVSGLADLLHMEQA